MMDRLIARAFATRNSAQLAHWRARGPGSYAKHMALGPFYDGLVDKIDAIVEAYQGAKGIVSVTFESARVDPDHILAHLVTEAEWLKTNRDEIAAGIPSIANMLDDLHALYLTTIYKLTHLA